MRSPMQDLDAGSLTYLVCVGMACYFIMKKLPGILILPALIVVFVLGGMGFQAVYK